MKIAQICAYFPPHLGGMEQRVKDLSERLTKKGHNVEVFTSDIECNRNQQIKSKDNLEINYLKGREFFRTAVIPSLYNKLMKIPKDSVMHVHIAQAFVPEIVWLVSKLRKIPYITHIRGDVSPSSWLGKIILNPYKKIFLKKVIKDSSKVIVLTEDYKKLVSKKYKIKWEKIVVIPNATDFKSAEKINIKPLVKNILFVGRLSHEKNIDLIINALAKINNKNLVFSLAGEGDIKSQLTNLVKEKNLEKQVIFLGNLSREKLYSVYLNSDIFLLTSKVESFGTVLLEAMACGVPIIASDIPGIRSVIKNGYNGLLVEPTPKKIAEAIEKLIKNPKLRKKLAENGLNEVKKYSWDKIVKQTEEVYKEVLKEHNANNKK